MAESGHIRNVEHFQMMIAAVGGFGAGYAPSNPALAVGALSAALTAGDAGIDAVTDNLIPWKVKVNERESEYDGVGKLCTRIQAAFAASGAAPQAVDDMKSFVRQLRGERANKIPVDDPNTPADESKHNSVSQRSYTQTLEHFDSIRKMCETEPMYSPNEPDLQVASLAAKASAMKNANQAVIDAVPPVDNARITRNAALYSDTGIVELAKLVKLYVKSAFGADSPQYAQIKGLEFTKPR